MHHIGPDLRPVPPWMRKHVLGTLARLLMMRKRKPPGVRKTNVIGEKLAQDFRTWEQQELLSIVHGHLQNSPQIMRHRFANPCNGISLSRESKDDRRSACTSEQGSPSFSTAHMSKQNDVLKLLLKEVKKITAHVENDSADNKLKDEWKRVALVLDRLFLIIFVFCTFGTFLVMFWQI